MTAANTPAHILLADDEETFRLSTADLLRQEGYRVTEATSATEARAVLDREPVDLLVSDIRMSGNENLDLVRPMRATPGTPPIILVTGYPSSATAVPALNMAVSAYLAKPLDVEDFLSHVRRAVEQRRAERSLDSLRERAEEWRAELVALERATRTGRGPRAGSLSAFADVTLGTIARRSMTCGGSWMPPAAGRWSHRPASR